MENNNYEEIDHSELNEMLKNQDFINDLKDKEKKAVQHKDIIGLYNILDTLLVLEADENRINTIYSKILIMSLREIEDKFKSKEKLNLDNNSNNLYYIRAFYEYAVELWSNNNQDKALEVIFTIIKVCEDSILENSFLIIFISLIKKESIEEFQDNYLDMNFETDIDDEKYIYFPTKFSFNIKNFLDENQDLINKEFSRLENKLSLQG